MSPRLAVVLVSLLSLLLFLGSRGLSEPDEGRFAEASREMSLQSNWLVPHLAGVPHLQKPPLIFWITALSIKVFGVNEWAARLPSAVAAFGTMLLTMHLAGLLFGASVEWKAGLILLSSGLFFMMARIITTDMMLTFWITCAVVSFVHYTKRNSITALMVFYLSLGLGFLTKGPMAYLVPFAAVIPWAVACRKEQKAPGWYWHWVPGVMFAVAISISWFVLLFRHYPGLFDYYYHYEFIDRIASNTHHRAKPFWFYTLVMVAGLLPWSVMLPRIVADQWRRRGVRRRPEFWLFAGWLIIPWLVLHLVSSKLVTYILPLFPPIAIVLAGKWDSLQVRWRPEIRVVAALFAVMMAGLPLTFYLLSKDNGEPIHIHYLFTVGVIAACMVWLLIYISVDSYRHRTLQFGSLGVMMLVSLLLILSRADQLLQNRNKSMALLADEIKLSQREYPQAKLFAPNMKKFGLEFYLQKPIIRTASSVESTLPIPAELSDLFVADPFVYLKSNAQDEFLILIARYFLPDPLPSDWDIVADFRDTVLVYRAGLQQ